jgi:endonuclease YncB( thermonuclease family)
MTPLKHAVRLWIIGAAAALPLLSISIARCEPVAPSDVRIIDGDTVEVEGKRIRLVGFDAPELDHARCAAERGLAERAASRLRQIVREGDDIDVRFIACSCRSGTEGTKACNWGRACAYLIVDGKDVGGVLMAELLAHPYVCSAYRCPRRQPWC